MSTSKLVVKTPPGGVTKDEARALAMELLTFAHDEEEMVVVPKRCFEGLEKSLKKLSKDIDNDFYPTIRAWQVLRWVKKLAKGAVFTRNENIHSSVYLLWDETEDGPEP